MANTVLHLTIKKYWFDMIKSGIKKEEYRELKDYWISRLCKKYKPSVIVGGDFRSKHTGINYDFKQYSFVEFKNGYSKESPTIIVEFKGIRIGTPEPEWYFDNIELKNDNYNDCFIIELGNVLI